MKLEARTLAKGLIGGAVALVLALQLVPYGRDHAPPPSSGEPTWDSPRTRELAKRACFDCHSHETVWPVYASIAPFSWLVQDHVEEGREMLNFSTFATAPGKEAEEAAEVVEEGEMPPRYYRILHPSARLTEAEARELIAGLEATLGDLEEAEADAGRRGRGRRGRDREQEEEDEGH